MVSRRGYHLVVTEPDWRSVTELGTCSDHQDDHQSGVCPQTVFSPSLKTYALIWLLSRLRKVAKMALLTTHDSRLTPHASRLSLHSPPFIRRATQ